MNHTRRALAGLGILAVLGGLASLPAHAAQAAPAAPAAPATAPPAPPGLSAGAQRVWNARAASAVIVKASAHTRTPLGKGLYREHWTETRADGRTIDITNDDAGPVIVQQGDTVNGAAPVKGASAPAALATATNTYTWPKSEVWRVDEDTRWAPNGSSYKSSIAMGYNMVRVMYSDGTHKDYFQIHSGDEASPPLIYRTTYPGAYGGLLNRFILEMYWQISPFGGVTTLGAGDCANSGAPCWANAQNSRPIANTGVAGAGGYTKAGVLETTHEAWGMSGSGGSWFRTSAALANNGRPVLLWYFNSEPRIDDGLADYAESYPFWDNNLAP